MGRNRSIAADTLGLLLTVVACAGSTFENGAGLRALDQTKAIYPAITKVRVEPTLKNRFVEHAATISADAAIVRRDIAKWLDEHLLS